MRKGRTGRFLPLILLIAGGMLTASAGVFRVMPGSEGCEALKGGMWTVSGENSGQDMIPADEADMALLRKYQALCPDVKGILRIAGTVLCHPIVQTPEEEEYYLYRDLRGEYNSHGVPFLSAESDLESRGGNIVIYGHNIYKKTRDVFCDLAGYEDVEYYREHPCIETVSESGVCRWLIFAYYLADNSDEDPFRYSDVTVFRGPEDMKAYLEKIEARNWLHVDADIEYGDTLITLSSCSVELAGSGTNRMVVVGKLLENGEDPAEIIEKALQAEHPLLPARLR